MIFQQFQDQLLVIRQSDHGRQTGLFARYWGNENTPPFSPREAVIAAGDRHDDGWIEWEANPSVDPKTGRPWHFYQLTPHEHIPLYQRGIEMAAQHDPTTGLLVSMHGAGLYNDRYGTYRLVDQDFSESERELVDEFLSEQRLFQQSLAERIEGQERHTHITNDPQVWYNYLLLQVWDRLSLQFAFRLAADGDIAPLPRPDGGTGVLRCSNDGPLSLRLDPYPFAQSSHTFPIAARLLPDKPYRGAEEFLAEMAKTEEIILECKLRRG